MIVLVAHRIGPSVYVGPFATYDEAQAWITEFGSPAGWSAIELQPPDREPNWSL